MNNSHELVDGVKGILVKDFNPKYKTIELLESKEMFPFGIFVSKPIGLFKFKKVKKAYGDRKIISVMDFNDTHTTSIAIEDAVFEKTKEYSKRKDVPEVVVNQHGNNCTCIDNAGTINIRMGK